MNINAGGDAGSHISIYSHKDEHKNETKRILQAKAQKEPAHLAGSFSRSRAR
jgi:hypothetical protein